MKSFEVIIQAGGGGLRKKRKKKKKLKGPRGFSFFLSFPFTILRHYL
jgi:hypothetical protein